MNSKYLDFESAFAFLWQNADGDGIWHGDASDLAAEFSSSEGEADRELYDLCDRKLIERLGPEEYCISNWPEDEAQRREYWNC
jgi:hypothetical protein